MTPDAGIDEKELSVLRKRLYHLTAERNEAAKNLSTDELRKIREEKIERVKRSRDEVIGTRSVATDGD
jgi:uncharacterized membrane protein (DUF106 family)